MIEKYIDRCLRHKNVLEKLEIVTNKKVYNVCGIGKKTKLFDFQGYSHPCKYLGQLIYVYLDNSQVWNAYKCVREEE